MNIIVVRGVNIIVDRMIIVDWMKIVVVRRMIARINDMIVNTLPGRRES
jgi:hypothetical protein